MFSKKAFMMVYVVIVVILSAFISKSLRKVMRKHPLFFFFLLSYAFSWIISIPYVLSVWGILPGDYTIGLMLKQWMGPALAAIDTPQVVWVPLFLEVGESNSTVGETSLDLALLITFGVLALLIVILTRGRLGYQPGQEQPRGQERTNCNLPFKKTV